MTKSKKEQDIVHLNGGAAGGSTSKRQKVDKSGASVPNATTTSTNANSVKIKLFGNQQVPMASQLPSQLGGML